MDDASTARAQSYLHPPIALWRLALLMCATLSFYQMRWAYRSAKELRVTGRETTTPWLWIFAFIGPLVVAIALGRLGGMHQRWRDDVIGGASRGGWITPVVIMLALLTQLIFITSNFISPGYWLLAAVAALLVLPTLYICLLQSRVNAIKAALNETAFHYQARSFTGLQWTALGFGMPLTIAMFALWSWNYWQMGDLASLSKGEYLTVENSAFRVRVPEQGWNRVAAAYLTDESDLSLISNDQSAWAMLFVQHNMDVASVMSNRASAMLLSPTLDNCHSRLEMDDSLRSVGTILCTTASELGFGKAHYAIRIVESGKHAAELIVYGEAGQSKFQRMRQRTIAMSEALEVSDDKN